MNAVPKVTVLVVPLVIVTVPFNVGKSGTAMVRYAGVLDPPDTAEARNMFAAWELAVMATVMVPLLVTGEDVTAAVKYVGTVTVSPTDVTYGKPLGMSVTARAR